MSYYKSSEMNKKNTESWKQNLSYDTTRRRDIPIIEALGTFTRLPFKKHIIGRLEFTIRIYKRKEY